MMKLNTKHWILLGSLAASIPAFASRARVMVMGSGDPTGMIIHSRGNGGSYYYDSPYSMFYNPAAIMGYTNFAVVEKSNHPGSSAMGVLIKEVGTLRVGAVLGRQWDSSLPSRAGDLTGIFANLPGANAGQVRTLELFAGMNLNEMGSAGLGLSWGRFVDGMRTATKDDDFSATLLKLRLGAKIKNIEPFGHINLIGREKLNNSVPAAVMDVRHRDFMLGARFVMDEKGLKAVGGYRRYTQKVKSPAGFGDQVQDAFGLDVNHEVAFTEGGRIYYGGGFWRITSVDNDLVPFHMAIEMDPYSWLTFRAGLMHTLYNFSKGTSGSNSTTGRLGFSLKRDKYAFDWMVGSNSSRTGSVGAAFESGADGDSQAFGFDGGFFTAAAIRAEW